MQTSRPDTDSNPLRSAVRRARLFTLAHRRLVAALCAALAVAASLAALRPAESATQSVVVAARDIDSGATLGADDLHVRELAADSVPAHSFPETNAVIGETAGAPMREGEVVTDMRLLAADALAGYPEDTTLATVRIADPQSLWGVEVGTYVDIVGVNPDTNNSGDVVASGAQVAAMPDSGSTEVGVDAGAVLVVAVPAETAVGLTDASSRMQLSAVISDTPDNRK